MQKEVQKADFVIEINGISAQFKKPDFRVWKFAVTAMRKSGALAFKIAMAKNCCLDKASVLISDEYIEQTADSLMTEIEYSEASVERDGNSFVVEIDGYSCRLKPLSIEARLAAERNAGEQPFAEQLLLLEALWLNGDEEIKSQLRPELLIPVLKEIGNLKDKHLATIKKL